MFTYRNKRTKQEVTYPERSTRLDGLSTVWVLTDENAEEPAGKPQQPTPDPDQPQPGTDPMPVPDQPAPAAHVFDPDGGYRFGRPAEGATLADLKGFADTHGIHLDGTKKADIEAEIEEALSTLETRAFAAGVEVEGRTFAAVAEDVIALDDDDTDGEG